MSFCQDLTSKLIGSEKNLISWPLFVYIYAYGLVQRNMINMFDNNEIFINLVINIVSNDVSIYSKNNKESFLWIDLFIFRLATNCITTEL